MERRSELQLTTEESLADKQVVIAMDGGRAHTRTYELDKVGRCEKLDTSWREPKRFVISTLDKKGRLNEVAPPIYDVTFGAKYRTKVE